MNAKQPDAKQPDASRPDASRPDENLPAVTPRHVPAPEGTPWPTSEWPRGRHARHERLERVVAEAFELDELAETNAVVIVQAGRVLVERYAGERPFFDRPSEPITATSTLHSWSIAKSFLHLLVGTLVEEGRLDPDDLAAVPEWRLEHDPRHAIRVADLLAMRDGLDFVEEYELGRASDVIEMLFGQGQRDVAGYAAAKPLAHEPGTFFHYSSGTSNILSRIVADLVGHGERYREFIEERIFSPLGMRGASATFDETGVFIASSYVYATALDYAKFGLLYLRGGQWEDRQLVSPSWVATAQVPLSADLEGGTWYSWHWWVTGDRYGTYGASGYEGQMISVAPALDAVVVRFGHTPEERAPELGAWRSRVLDVLAEDGI